MFEAIFIMGGLGVIVGIGLAIASKVFYVYVDPKIVAVENVLPGANCGGCGYPGCSSNAEAVVAGKASPNSCVAAGDDVAQAIAAILGVSVEAKEPDIAKPGCFFGTADADQKYVYMGLSNCKAAALLGGGMKVCNIGCLGLGSCASACPFDAIVMGPEGLPIVDEAKCTGCGTCERVCPKHIIKLSSVTRRILKEYTVEDCTTPCQRACPAGIDIREYIRQITLGDYHRSVQIIKERNPFPTVIGRICPRPCELSCRRTICDDPVAINFLKRFAADFERNSGQRIQPFRAPESGKRIAIIGGGVQGLSSAFFSARLGHQITVFDAEEKPGGLLRKAIARYRLQQDILDWDIQGIVEMGVSLVPSTVLGKDVHLDAILAEGYDALFLAAGGWDSRLTRNTSNEEPIPGVNLIIDFMMSIAGNSPQKSCGPHVVIAGKGTAVLETAYLCLQQGADNVTILFSESQDQAKIDQEAMQTAEHKGIKLVFQAKITRILGQGKQLTNIEYIDEIFQSKVELKADNLLIASGRYPEMVFMAEKPESTEAGLQEGESAKSIDFKAEHIRWIGRLPYKDPEYKDSTGMLACGDVLSDYSAAIKAIGAGRRAAATIHQAMYGIEPSLPDNVVHSGSAIQQVDQLENVAITPRYPMPLCPSAEQDYGLGGELEMGFDEETAQAEAARCLQCGLICYEKQPMEITLKLESAA